MCNIILAFVRIFDVASCGVFALNHYSAAVRGPSPKEEGSCEDCPDAFHTLVGVVYEVIVTQVWWTYLQWMLSGKLEWWC